MAYPMGANDSAVLESIKQSLHQSKISGSPVAAVVIEPMNSTSGHSASDKFLKELKSISADSEAAFIVDATETGCGATGKSFWGFTGEADYLVFGKRTQVEGFYSKPSSK
jgi:4-aminobutyrate aminotransferase-like enzyme